MPDDSVIVWDLETYPDLAAARRLLGLANHTDDEVRAGLGDGFPKLPLHSICCIGALVAARRPEGWAVEALGAPHAGDRPEPELIAAFVNRIDELLPKLVTFNGSGFDLPVLRYRAMMHAIPAPGLRKRPYFNRFAEDAFDLCDVLASYGASKKVKLNELAKVFGLPGKPEGMDGSEVENYVRAGRIREVADYCETDVVNTYRVWLRHELFRGSLDQAALAASERQLTDFIQKRSFKNPHLQ